MNAKYAEAETPTSIISHISVVKRGSGLLDTENIAHSILVWNRLYFGSLILSLIAGILALGSSVKVNQYTSQLSDAKDKQMENLQRQIDLHEPFVNGKPVHSRP
jgi:hypothetical protein